MSSNLSSTQSSCSSSAWGAASARLPELKDYRGGAHARTRAQAIPNARRSSRRPCPRPPAIMSTLPEQRTRAARPSDDARALPRRPRLSRLCLSDRRSNFRQRRFEEGVGGLHTLLLEERWRFSHPHGGPRPAADSSFRLVCTFCDCHIIHCMRGSRWGQTSQQGGTICPCLSGTGSMACITPGMRSTGTRTASET